MAASGKARRFFLGSGACAAILPSRFPPRYLPKEMETHPHRCIGRNLMYGFIHNSPKLDAIPVSPGWWLDAQIVACLRTGGCRWAVRTRTPSTHSTEGPLMLAERREPDSNGAVYDSVYMTSWKRQNSQNQTMDLCLSGAKEWNQRIGYRGGTKELFGAKEYSVSSIWWLHNFIHQSSQSG